MEVMEVTFVLYGLVGVTFVMYRRTYVLYGLAGVTFVMYRRTYVLYGLAGVTFVMYTHTPAVSVIKMRCVGLSCDHNL